MASVVTTEFVRTTHADAPPFSLIEQEGLVSRLLRALEGAVGELTRDPRGFIRELVSADTKDAKLRQRLYIGLSCAVILHVALLTLIAAFGWHKFMKPVEPRAGVVWAPLNSPEKTSDTAGVVPRGVKEAGSGGGGDHNPLPPTKGPLPQMSTGPQIVKPNTPSVVLPKIQVPPTIVGPDSSSPPPGIALGIPTGAIAAAPSPGPGEGGGLGSNRGTGAGSGSGPSSGKGNNGGGPGGMNRIGVPNGVDDPKGPFNYNLFTKFPDRTPIVWLHRPTPVITPEAQANKVPGVVWLRATFSKDSKISDIEVIASEVPSMTESAIESLQRSSFTPATIKGRPVTLINVPVRINVLVVQR